MATKKKAESKAEEKKVARHVLRRDLLVEKAIEQIGVKEDNGVNDGEPFERYALLGEQPLPWCARFVRWLFGEVGLQIPGNQYNLASVAHMERVFREQGWHYREPRVGDVVFYGGRGQSDAGNGRHCGIVVAVNGLHIETIEGNLSNRVKRVRQTTQANVRITGFGRHPRLDEETETWTN